MRTTEKNVEPLLIYALFDANKHVLANLGPFCNAISAAILRVYIVHGHSVYSRLDAKRALKKIFVNSKGHENRLISAFHLKGQ